jgi:hypothetical protein
MKASSNFTGIELISIERQEQVTIHGYDKLWVENNPHYYDGGQLAYAAEMLLSSERNEGIDPFSYPDGWPERDCQKMLRKPYIEKLVVAGALIAAEIDRLQNQKS